MPRQRISGDLSTNHQSGLNNPLVLIVPTRRFSLSKKIVCRILASGQFDPSPEQTPRALAMMTRPAGLIQPHRSKGCDGLSLSFRPIVDLQDGHITARVERKHRSREFIQPLKDLDAHYPDEAVIRVILDNHSAHISKETQAYLATRRNRFRYVHTPTHGSWLNLVETLFGKMAHTFLRGIRVHSWDELRERILKGVAEINAAPVVHRWKKFRAIG